MKEEDALSALFFNFPLVYAFKNIKEKQVRLKLNETDQLRSSVVALIY
jgi:hypothetical protein